MTTDTAARHHHDWYVLDADRDYCRGCEAIKDMRPAEPVYRISDAARWVLGLDLSTPSLPRHTRRYWRKPAVEPETRA